MGGLLETVELSSLAKPFAAALAFLGFIAGVLYAVGGAIYDVLKGQVGSGTVLAFFAIIGMPILFATFGLIVGAIGAFLNNRVAGWVGE